MRIGKPKRTRHIAIPMPDWPRRKQKPIRVPDWPVPVKVPQTK